MARATKTPNPPTPEATAAAADLRDEHDRISYSVGYQVGSDFRRQGQALIPEALARGARDGAGGAEPALSAEEMGILLQALKRKIAAAQQEERERALRQIQEASEAFLKKNARRKGVVSLPSGLQYKVGREGSGDRTPGPDDVVTVHYRGMLPDGTEFDSSHGRGAPATFQLAQVIKGWTEGVQLMKPGALHTLYVPAELGYGARGAGRIPPHSALVFEIELLSIEGG